jgi:hypothetical protein
MREDNSSYKISRVKPDTTKRVHRIRDDIEAFYLEILAKERIQGLEEVLKGTNVSVIDVRTDDTDRVRARQNVADTLVKYPDIACLVGIWSYNGPAIINSVKTAGKSLPGVPRRTILSQPRDAAPAVNFVCSKATSLRNRLPAALKASG